MPPSLSRVSETQNVAIWPSSYQVNESTSGVLSALASTFDTSFIGLQEKTNWMKVETSLKSFGATYKLNFILTRTYATGLSRAQILTLPFLIASLGICHPKPQRFWLWHSRRPEIPAFWQPVISSPNQSPVILKQPVLKLLSWSVRNTGIMNSQKKTWQSVCVLKIQVKDLVSLATIFMTPVWLTGSPQKKESFPKQRPQAQKTAPGSP